MEPVQRGVPQYVTARRFLLAAALVIVVSACTTVGVPGATPPPATGALPTAASTVIETTGASVLPSSAPSESPVATVTLAPSTPTPTPRPRRSKTPRPSLEATATPTATPTEAPTATPTASPTAPPLMPDLIVKTFSVPATVTHGEEAVGGMYVQNVGPGDAGAFSVDFYGSCSNEAFSDAPHDVAGLVAGADKFIRLTFTFDSIGDCSVGAEIDHDNQVTESNESNNTVSVSVTSQ